MNATLYTYCQDNVTIKNISKWFTFNVCDNLMALFSKICMQIQTCPLLLYNTCPCSQTPIKTSQILMLLFTVNSSLKLFDMMMHTPIDQHINFFNYVETFYNSFIIDGWEYIVIFLFLPQEFHYVVASIQWC